MGWLRKNGIFPAGSRPHPKWVSVIAHYGFGAKGIVYALVGVLAARAAWLTGRAPNGAREALATIGRQPLGRVLLIVTAGGLASYAAWRMIEAIYDPDSRARGKARVILRTGFLLSSVAYFMLALIAVSLAVGWGTGGESERSLAARLLALPLGYVILGLIGASVVAVGFVQFYSAWTAGFMREYESQQMSAARRRWAKRLGQYGLIARGVTFLIIGVFLIEAARQSNAGAVKGLGGALAVLAAQPFGNWLLLIVAFGLLSYGLYCLSRAWLRRNPLRSLAGG